MKNEVIEADKSVRINSTVFKNWRLLTLLPGLLRPFTAMQQLLRKHGDFLTFHVMGGPVHVLTVHPSLVQHLLKTNPANYVRGKAIFPIKKLLGNGIFMSESPAWEKQHLWLKPAFHDNQIRDYMQVVHSELDIMIGQWEQAAGRKQAVNLSYDLKILMLKILIKTQFSSRAVVDYNQLLSSIDRILDASSFQSFILSALQKAVLAPLGWRPESEEQKALRALASVVDTMIEAARRDRDAAGFVTTVMLEALDKKELVYEDIRDMYMNLLFAGFDTVATGLAFTLDSLGRHPLYQEQAFAEAEFHIKDDRPDISILKKMPYTKMVIQEGLRLFPPAWGIHRYAVQDDEIFGQEIKAKTYITISIYHLHRHPSFWKHPQSFYPEHFSSEQFKGKSFAYIPFGHGQRMCVGKPLAMIEMQLLLPLLLRRFQFTSTLRQEPDLKPGIIIQPSRPLMAHLTTRRA